MTRTGKFVTFVVFGLVVAAVAVPRWRASRSASQAAPAASTSTEARPVPVVVEAARVTPLVESLSTTGSLRANEQIDLTSEISGQVAALRFQEGSAVAAGQVLLEIDASELEAQRARATYRLDLAQRREARQKQLLQDGLISAQEYDFARSDLEVLQAELALVAAQLDKTLVRAPFGGVVGLRYVSLGAYVTPQTRIASLQDLDPMKVDFSVPERYAQRVRVGQVVTLSVAGIEGRFEARIFAIEPAVEASTRSLTVRARMPNAANRLRPGAFADVEVVITEVPAALTVPSVAVIPELGGKKVLVVEDGVVASRPVETGIRTDTRIEVTAGLEAGDRVIVRGLQGLTAGTAVEATEATAQAPGESLTEAPAQAATQAVEAD
jgi:membrane fusion protein (multidrug efflux system)